MSKIETVTLTDRVAAALRVLDDAITKYEPQHVFALFSGGGDSTVSAHVASKHPRFNGAAYIDTGTSLPGVLDHVERVCYDQLWPLEVLRSPQTYEDMIREYGLPGPGQHGSAYVRLKEKALDQFVRDLCQLCIREEKHREHQRIMWISGSRASESERRMRNATEAVEKDGSQIWVNIILDWTSQMCADYRDLHGLPTSDVAALIHRSGECNCGTYAQPGEKEMLCAMFPEFAERVAAWENLALEHGHHYAAVWGQRPLKVHRDQVVLIPRGKARACSDCERWAA